MPRGTLIAAIVITAIVVGAAVAVALPAITPPPAAVTVTQTRTETRTTTATAVQTTTVAPPPPERVTIRFAALGPYASDTLAVTAQKKGFFEKYNLNVEITPLRTSGAVIEAIAAGEMDIGHASILVTMQAAQRGFYPAVIGPISCDGRNPLSGVMYSQGAIALGRDIAEIKDLKGKAIASAGPGSTDYWAVRAVLEQAGLDPDRDVRHISLPAGSEMVAALATGEIDAFMTVQLYVQDAIKKGIGRDSGINPGLVLYGTDWFMWTGAPVNQDFLAENPDAVHRFAKAFAEAAEWITVYRNQWKEEILSPHTGVEYDVLAAMPDPALGYFLPYRDGWTDGLPILTKMMDKLVEIKLLDGPVDLKRLLTLPWFTPA